MYTYMYMYANQGEVEDIIPPGDRVFIRQTTQLHIPVSKLPMAACICLF